MQTITIRESENFKLDSTGNGWAYTLTRKDTNESVFVQDGDAIEFNVCLETWETIKPETKTNEILWFMWSSYNVS